MSITSLIEPNALSMPAAVNFDDETSETAPAIFGRRWMAAHAMGASFELSLVLGGLAALIR